MATSLKKKKENIEMGNHSTIFSKKAWKFTDNKNDYSHNHLHPEGIESVF